MDNLTVVVPFYNGHEHIERLLDSIPASIPIWIIDDQSDEPLPLIRRAGVRSFRLQRKGYFAGAVNRGIELTKTDVLILNQDSWLEGDRWLDLIERLRKDYAFFGERIQGLHPAFGTLGYAHGTFLYIRRDAIRRVGLLNDRDFPLWGGTAEYQWRVARAGFHVRPLPTIPGFRHARGSAPYGDGIQTLLRREPDKRDLLIRTPPLVSVVVSNYNGGKYLSDAVNSLVGGPTSLGNHPGQTLGAFEVIIADDASTDHSRQVIESLISEEKGVRAIYRQRNGGSAACYNSGVQAAVGQYVTVLNGDDMREPWALETLYRAALAHPRHWVYDDVQIVTRGERGKVMKMPRYDFDILIHKNQAHVGILYPRKAWQDAGGYPERFNRGREDWAFNVALSAKGYCGLHVQHAGIEGLDTRPGYLYRREGQNRTLRNTSPWHHERFRKQLEQEFPEIYGGNYMGCCGGSTTKANGGGGGGGTSSAATTTTRSLAGPAPSGDMVQLEYTGPNAGTETWGGAGATPSGLRYIFGGSQRHRVKWVDRRDAQWFLDRRQDGRNLFKRYAPQTEPAQVKEEATAKLVTRPEPTEDTLPDPSTLTVDEIKGLDLHPSAWAELLDREKAGKNRTTAISHIEEQIAGAESD